MAAPKSSAQRQREYRQRIAASRTPAQSLATRISETERKRNYRLRKAAKLARASGSLETTTATPSRSAGRSNDVQNSTQQQFTNQQRQSLAAEPAQTTVQPGTSSDQIEVPDEPMNIKDLPLPSRSNAPVETQDAAASTSATPFAEPPKIAAPKSSAQRQREYRQRIAASRTLAQALATRISETERKRNYRLRKAAKLARASGLLESTTASSSRSAGRSNNDQNSTQRQLTNQQRQSLAAEPAQTTVQKKRSLRKHVRTKQPKSTAFSQCHICQKRFESAKSCKIHLKLLHSTNMNMFPCHLCSVSFSSNEALLIHLQTKHLAEDEIYKCEECNLVFKGQDKFDSHNDECHVNVVPNIKQKVLPRCILCMKDFSTRKTMKSHIKKFHEDFDVDELANFGSRRRTFNVDCEDCIKNFTDDFYFNIYTKLKHLRDSVIFKCDTCCESYNSLEFAIQRYRVSNADMCRSKMILSELCTTEMSDEENGFSNFGALHDMLPESTTLDIKPEPLDVCEVEIKVEPVSP